jgi:hypothetical protein
MDGEGTKEKKMKRNEQKREREARFNEFDKEEMKEITKRVFLQGKAIKNNAECMRKIYVLYCITGNRKTTGKYVA